MPNQSVMKQVITISHKDGVVSTFTPIEIAIENEYECILSINNRFFTLRQEGVPLGLKTSMTSHQIGDIRASINHDSTNQGKSVVTITRYVKSDNTDNVTNGFFEKASDRLLGFPEFSKLTISKKSKLIQRRGKHMSAVARKLASNALSRKLACEA